MSETGSPTVVMARATSAAWGYPTAVAGWYARLGVRRPGVRVGLGCLGFAVFGWAFLLMWFLFFAIAETVTLFYALAVTALLLAVAIAESVVRLGAWVAHR